MRSRWLPLSLPRCEAALGTNVMFRPAVSDQECAHPIKRGSKPCERFRVQLTTQHSSQAEVR